MYNARDRITRGMLKAEAVLPTGKVVVCDMKLPKDTGAIYVSTEERRLAKEKRENRKKIAQERRAKAREDKQTEREFVEQQGKIEDIVVTETPVEYAFDKEVAFSEEEKTQIAQEMCGIRA